MNKSAKKSNPKSRNWLQRLTASLGVLPKDRHQLTEVLREAKENDVLSAEILEMIERILRVSEIQVRDIMVPKAQMVVLFDYYQLKDILPIITESGHSRFPIVDKTGKEVIGLLLAKDLLHYFLNEKATTFELAKMIRPAFFTPQSKRLEILLKEFRANRNHIAIVLDEYGQTAGLITIEDVLEQIVGDIEDEYDIDEDSGDIRKNTDGTYLVKASTLIEDFNQYFHTHFDDDEFDTIGGIILQQFGHLPERGDTLKIKDLRFKVISADARRIYLFEIKELKPKKSKKS